MTLVDVFSLLLFEGSLQAGLTGLVLVGIALSIRRRNTALAHGLVALALIKFALPPIVFVPTGLFSELGVRFQVETPSGSSSTMQVLMFVYFAGVMVAAVGRVRELRQLRRFSTEAKRASERSEATLECLTKKLRPRVRPVLRVSADVPVPCTFGVLEPVILIPLALEERLTDAELRAVLLHELGHVRYRDAVWNLLATLLGIVWWFHPVFHVVDRIARALREDRCDDDVIHGGVEPTDYARAIVTVAAFQSGRASVFASGAGGGHPLARRIRNIARPRPDRPTRIRALGWSVLLTAALLLLPGVRLQSSHTPEHVFFVHDDNHQHQHEHGH